MRCPTAARFVFVVCLLGACDEGGGGAPVPSRVVAVEAEEERPDLAGFCDVREQTGAPAFTLPPVEGDGARPARGRWQWLNVWATWCKPCVEEMPMLLEWQKRLVSEGAKVDLLFLSVDAESEAVASFREKHPQTPATLRLTEQDALEGWLTGLGMDPGATIPLQIFADPGGKVRCVRSGAVNRSDYATVQALVGAS